MTLRINLVSFRTFRYPLFPKPVSGWDFFAASYSKTALPSYGITPKPRTSAFFSLHHRTILDRKFQPSAICTSFNQSLQSSAIKIAELFCNWLKDEQKVGIFKLNSFICKKNSDFLTPLGPLRARPYRFE